MKFPTGFTCRNLHGFARFPGDSTALVLHVYVFVKFRTCISIDGSVSYVKNSKWQLSDILNCHLVTLDHPRSPFVQRSVFISFRSSL